MRSQEHDVIVLGAGPAGEVAAGCLADAGLDIALVERNLVGGECSFYGCMPSKALLRPAQVLAEVGRIPGAAEAVTGAIDTAAGRTFGPPTRARAAERPSCRCLRG